MIGTALVLAQTLALTAPAPEPRFCPNRPDLGASACTTEPGRVLIEGSGVDWTRTDDADTREDVVLAGDLLVRIGVDPDTELQLGWTPFGRVRSRDKATGEAAVHEGVGDVRLAVRRNLQGNAGGALMLAVESFVTVPVGKAGIGAGGWSGGVVLPVSYDLSDRWALLFTGDTAVLPDQDWRGHHLVMGGTFGLGRALGERLGVVAELAVTREAEAGAVRTDWVTALSVGWQPRPGLQFDLLGVAGINRTAPDVQIQIGGAILF